MQTVHSGGLRMGRCTVVITFSRFTSVIRDFGRRSCRVDGTPHYAVLNQLGATTVRMATKMNVHRRQLVPTTQDACRLVCHSTLPEPEVL